MATQDTPQEVGAPATQPQAQGSPPGDQAPPPEVPASTEESPAVSEVVEKVGKWFGSLPLQAKLAVVLYDAYVHNDSTREWVRDIEGEFEDEILALAEHPPADLRGEDAVLIGRAVDAVFMLEMQ